MMMAPISHLLEEVLLETFVMGLDEVIKVELECRESVKLDEVMKKAQLLETKELARKEKKKRKKEGLAHFGNPKVVAMKNEGSLTHA